MSIGLTLRRIGGSLATAPLVFLYVRSEVSGIVYPAAVVSRAASSVFLIAPAVAGMSAWRAGVLRSGRIATLAPARSTWALASRELLPVWAGGVAVLFAGLGWAWLFSDTAALESPAWPVVVTSVIVLGAHGVVGFAIGSIVPRALGAATAIVLSYLWMVFPQAWEPLWLRHMTGFVNACCGLWAELDPGVVLAPAVLGLSIGAASLALVARGLVTLRVLIAAIVAVAGILLAASMVDHLGPDPVRPRSEGDLSCWRTEADLEVCLWPENSSRLNDVAESASIVSDALAPYNVRTPLVVTEASSEGLPTTWSIGIGPKTDTALIMGELVGALVPVPSDCGNARALEDADVLFGWILSKVLVGVDPAHFSPTPAVARRVLAVNDQPMPSQASWFNDESQGLRSCGAG